MHRRLFILGLLTVGIAVASSCGSTSKGACGPVTRDTLDPSSLNHVLPGAPAPSYLTDPPTSGAHQPAPPISGVQHSPIAPQIQVGVLEAGHVIIQYDDLSKTDIGKLERLASKRAVVAPAHQLPNGSHVVATAWVTHQRCRALDIATMQQFITKREGKGPGHA